MSCIAEIFVKYCSTTVSWLFQRMSQFTLLRLLTAGGKLCNGIIMKWPMEQTRLALKKRMLINCNLVCLKFKSLSFTYITKIVIRLQPITILRPERNGVDFGDKCFDSMFAKFYSELIIVPYNDAVPTGNIQLALQWRHMSIVVP